MDLGDGEVIDASQCGSILRFVNHSCGPNAETQKWTIQDKQRIGLFAKDYIEKGEEVCERWRCPRYAPPCWARRMYIGRVQDVLVVLRP